MAWLLVMTGRASTCSSRDMIPGDRIAVQLRKQPSDLVEWCSGIPIVQGRWRQAGHFGIGIDAEVCAVDDIDVMCGKESDFARMDRFDIGREHESRLMSRVLTAPTIASDARRPECPSPARCGFGSFPPHAERRSHGRAGECDQIDLGVGEKPGWTSVPHPDEFRLRTATQGQSGKKRRNAARQMADFCFSHHVSGKHETPARNCRRSRYRDLRRKRARS